MHALLQDWIINDRSRLKYLRVLTAVFLLFCTGLPAADESGTGPEFRTENMRTRLLSEFSQIAPGQTFLVALRQQIRPHWHTYWRNPGDSGEPTSLDWQLPAGWQASEILWPAPRRIAVGPLVNFGYSDEVLLLVRIQAPATLEAGRSITLSAGAYWLVCEEICIPEEATLELRLQIAEEPRPSPWQETLVRAEAGLPQPLPWPASYRLESGRLYIEAQIPAAAELAEAQFFPYRKDVIDNAAQQRIKIDDGRMTLSVATRFGAAGAAPDGLLVLTEKVADQQLRGAYRLSFSAARQTPVQGPVQADTATSAWLALLLAFVGGLLLNLMPCVFPVLSIKVLSLLQIAGTGERERSLVAAAHGGLYTLGVVAGFLALAAALLILRSAGAMIGWGFQLQNPYLVIALAWLFFIIGLNLSGVWTLSGSWTGAGQSLTEGHGARQSFFTGLLATLVATPCTAPFMGVALGYALTQSTLVTLAIFTSLGLGMATPLLLLCLFPGWLRAVPRPGPWMDRFRELLAFPMYLSCAWLLWVFARQVGDLGILIGTGGAVVIAWLLWCGGIQQRFWRVVGRSAALLALLVLLLRVDQLTATDPAPDQTAGDGWREYSAEALEQARQLGPVFVNFTADWCITCKANEQVALSTDRVQALFENKGVTRLKADWTRRNSHITSALESFGRSGVPLYLWYADPGQQQAEILPQLLSERMLIKRLESLP